MATPFCHKPRYADRAYYYGRYLHNIVATGTNVSLSMNYEPKLEKSSLSQSISSEGHTVKVEIYRLEGDKTWVLEIEDEYGNSTVWDDEFDSDELALSEAKEAISSETISSFIGPADGKPDEEWR